MATIPYDLQREAGRVKDDRRLLDAVIRAIGPEWDPPHLTYFSTICGADYKTAIMGLKSRVKTWDDIVPEFARAGRRFEFQARDNVEQGYEVSAGDAYFAAAVLYAGAQWPIVENSQANRMLEERKTECYLEYVNYADHHAEAVEIPYRGRTLAGYFHLPPGYAGGRLPCLVMVNGMDAAKEQTLAASADRFLRRGFACLCLDGPGQGTSLTREIWYDPDSYGEVGTAAYDAMAGRPEVDPGRVIAWGMSFGAFWATQMVAAEPRFAACAVLYTCFEPGTSPFAEVASPFFRRRLMYMAGIHDDHEFDAFASKLDVRPLSARIRMPYLVVAGEGDGGGDVQGTIEHLNNIPGPKTLLLYSGDANASVNVRATRLGPPASAYVADWVTARAHGRPASSEYCVVDATGQVQRQPWGDRRTYDDRASVDLYRLFTDGFGRR